MPKWDRQAEALRLRRLRAHPIAGIAAFARISRGIQMGTAASSILQQRAGIGGLPVEGTVLTATSFDEQKQFKIRLLSTDVVAEGASAAVLKGMTVGTTFNSRPQVVALKVFRLPLNADQRELFCRELDAARRLGAQDRFVLPFLGMSVLGFQPVIISPFMRNGNILSYISSCRPFKVDRQSLVVQTADALQFLHAEAGLVHGDLKCENVLVSDDGHALLADLGLCAVIDKAEANATTSTSIRQWNTIRFAAPELLSDNAQAMSSTGLTTRVRSKTPQSDVFAFGMLLLQAFTGRLPWPECSTEVVIMKMLSPSRPVHPRPGSEITALGLSDAWWNVCLKCWQFQPEERPRMSEICQELRQNRRPDRITLRGHSSRVRTVAFLPCGRRLVSGSDDNTLRIWDIKTCQTVVGPLMGHKDWILSVAVSPNGRQIASGSADRSICRWDAEDGTFLGAPMRGHKRGITCVAYSPDGAYIVSGSEDCTVRLWNASTGNAVRRTATVLTRHASGVLSVAFSPDCSTIASGSKDGVILTSTTGQHIGLLAGHGGHVYSICFSANGKHIVSGSRDRTVRVWEVGSEELISTIRGHLQSISSVAIVPSGKYIASASWDKTIRIWDTATGSPVGAPLIGHDDWIDTVVMSPNGKTIVSSSRDKTIRIWDRF